ncbi:methylmalonyl-CoA epimerase [Halorientalis litorea]|uniref:methylmalonyl-CoA epimerase n=1 Tax=Halorientalis litorea TaxID=2931977 RepID=UPI001FF3A4D3|nr:methylmalonyl-CoA epimerase [Halorientalis litorea]
MHFDHAGIVTDDADTLAETYSELLDVPVAHRETFEGMAVVFLDTGDGYFELLEPLDDDAAVTRFLDENGPGIHHVALATDDIEAALRRADGMGVERIDEEPRPGAWGHEVAFLHPKDTGGILVEFVEH